MCVFVRMSVCLLCHASQHDMISRPLFLIQLLLIHSSHTISRKVQLYIYVLVHRCTTVLCVKTNKTDDMSFAFLTCRIVRQYDHWASYMTEAIQRGPHWRYERCGIATSAVSDSFLHAASCSFVSGRCSLVRGRWMHSSPWRAYAAVDKTLCSHSHVSAKCEALGFLSWAILSIIFYTVKNVVLDLINAFLQHSNLEPLFVVRVPPLWIKWIK